MKEEGRSRYLFYLRRFFLLTGILFLTALAGCQGSGNDTGTGSSPITGINWTTAVPGYPSLSGITWSGTQFAAAGQDGAILTSSDGITWTVRASGTTNDIDGTAWSGNEFADVGANGTILTSPDGITWTSGHQARQIISIALPGQAPSLLQRVEPAQFSPLPDGITWTTRISGTTNDLVGVTWSGTQFAAVGDWRNLHFS